MTIPYTRMADVRETLERVKAEQSRRIEGQHDDSKPLMLAFDRFDMLLEQAIHADAAMHTQHADMLRLLTNILANAKRTRVSLLTASNDYNETRDRLRHLIGQTALCDAGSHILLDQPTQPMADRTPLRNGNLTTALQHAWLDPANPMPGRGVYETNNGTLRPLNLTPVTLTKEA